MKTGLAVLSIFILLAVGGCNPDHSGDTQATIPVSNVPKQASGVDSNPNIPQSAKDQLSRSIPPMPKGN